MHNSLTLRKPFLVFLFLCPLLRLHPLQALQLLHQTALVRDKSLLYPGGRRWWRRRALVWPQLRLEMNNKKGIVFSFGTWHERLPQQQQMDTTKRRVGVCLCVIIYTLLIYPSLLLSLYNIIINSVFASSLPGFFSPLPSTRVSLTLCRIQTRQVQEPQGRGFSFALLSIHKNPLFLLAAHTCNTHADVAAPSGLIDSDESV